MRCGHGLTCSRPLVSVATSGCHGNMGWDGSPLPFHYLAVMFNYRTLSLVTDVECFEERGVGYFVCLLFVVAVCPLHSPNEKLCDLC
jgi:hypothetical protein